MSLSISTFSMYYNQISYLEAIEQLKNFEVVQLPYMEETARNSRISEYIDKVLSPESKQVEIDKNWKKMRKAARAKNK